MSYESKDMHATDAFTVHQDEGRWVLSWSGPSGSPLHDLSAACCKLLAEFQLAVTPGLVVDLSRVTLTLDMEQNSRLADRLVHEMLHPVPIAIIVRDRLSHAVARQFGLFAAVHGHHIGVVRDRKDAEAWFSDLVVDGAVMLGGSAADFTATFLGNSLAVRAAQ